jgi:hypothetical protein
MSRVRLAAIAAGLCVAGAGAWAANAQDFFKPLSRQCEHEQFALRHQFDPQGQRREWVHERLPEAVERDIAQFPGLSFASLLDYEHWTCHAREVGLTPLSLADVEADLKRCDRPPFQGAACRLTVRNRVVGLPPDDLRPTPPLPEVITTTTTQPPRKPAPREVVRACMDSEDHIAELSRQRDAGGASDAAQQAAFDTALRQHEKLCQGVVQSPADRAAILEERKAAAR